MCKDCLAHKCRKEMKHLRAASLVSAVAVAACVRHVWFWGRKQNTRNELKFLNSMLCMMLLCFQALNHDPVFIEEERANLTWEVALIGAPLLLWTSQSLCGASELWRIFIWRNLNHGGLLGLLFSPHVNLIRFLGETITLNNVLSVGSILKLWF